MYSNYTSQNIAELHPSRVIISSENVALNNEQMGNNQEIVKVTFDEKFKT